MSIRKIKGSDGIYRWEVRIYENGRGSKEIRKRFDKKVEAEKFQFQISKLKNERELNPWFREINF